MSTAACNGWIWGAGCRSGQRARNARAACGARGLNGGASGVAARCSAGAHGGAQRQGARAGKAGRGKRVVCGASGFCSVCWVWCARVQGIGPCSRFELRSTRFVQSQARRECSKSRSSTGARAPGTPHACAGNGWGRCGTRARACTGESPPRSLVDGSCTALEASEGKTPWLLAARVGLAVRGRTLSASSDMAVGVSWHVRSRATSRRRPCGAPHASALPRLCASAKSFPTHTSGQ